MLPCLPRLARTASVVGLTFASVGPLAISASPLACRALEPSNRPVEQCMRSCTAKASRQCSEAECNRGCELVLDRLVERETENVVGCVARGNRRCTDVVWAECAALVGPHADGGPPPPPPPVEDD